MSPCLVSFTLLIFLVIKQVIFSYDFYLKLIIMPSETSPGSFFENPPLNAKLKISKVYIGFFEKLPRHARLGNYSSLSGVFENPPLNAKLTSYSRLNRGSLFQKNVSQRRKTTFISYLVFPYPFSRNPKK